MTEQITVSRVVKSKEGKAYMEVGGKPFLYNAVQSWYPPEKDYSLYVQKAVEAHFKVFTFWLYWKHVEPVSGVYEWDELEKVVLLAEKYDIRLDIVWGGSNFCGQVDPRFAPEWLLNGHQYHVKDSNGECMLFDGADMGAVHAADPVNMELLERENKVIENMMGYLKQRDNTHRVIAVQVENEINMKDYAGGKSNILNYVNEIGRTIKASGHIIITRTNIYAREMDIELDRLQYIDGHGCDTYHWDVSVTRKVILSPYNTRFKYIAENAAYRNSSAHMITALANGGFYNIYKLDYDSVWGKPGVYNNGFEPWEATIDIRNLNQALNKIGAVIAESPKSHMIEFNTEAEEPESEYDRVKVLGNRKIGFSCKGNGAVGLVVQKEDSYYLIADKAAVFYLNEIPKKHEAGQMDDRGTWVAEYSKEIEKEGYGARGIYYNPGECINISF